jgi:hypothetical protein
MLALGTSGKLYTYMVHAYFYISYNQKLLKLISGSAILMSRVITRSI